MIHKMGKTKEINIKNRTYYYYNNIKKTLMIYIFMILVMNIRKKLQKVK